MVSDEKSLQRKRLREQRKALDGPVRAEADAAIMRNVVALDEFARADVIFPYLSMGDEVDTRGIINRAWKAGKRVALPYCIPGTRLMEWYEVTSFDGLVKSSFGVEEPVPDTATALNPRDFPNSIALVPGLSFDAQGYRMGYGGGFYDIFLAEYPGCSIGLCRSMFFDTVALSLEPHDLPVAIVVTDGQIVRIR